MEQSWCLSEQKPFSEVWNVQDACRPCISGKRCTGAVLGPSLLDRACCRDGSMPACPGGSLTACQKSSRRASVLTLCCFTAPKHQQHPDSCSNEVHAIGLCHVTPAQLASLRCLKQRSHHADDEVLNDLCWWECGLEGAACNVP